MKKYLFIVLFMAFYLYLPGQVDKSGLRDIFLPDYHFLKKELNRIQLPGNDSSRLDRFFHQIDTLLAEKKGRIHIVHIGASHVQADILSHQVRQHLDAINGESMTPRGFIFPYSIAKTNNPTNYRVSYSGEWESEKNVGRNRTKPLGVGGITVYTQDPAARLSIDLNPDSVARWQFNRLRLLGYAEDSTCMVTPVLFHGNDIIEGQLDLSSDTYLFELPALAGSFSMGFIQHDTVPHTFMIHGFLPENDSPGIVYHAIGVNGAAVPSYLSCEDFEKELAILNPDLIIFGIGINDATSGDFTQEGFVLNYRYLLEKIERASPDCAYLFITNNDSFRKVSRRRYMVNKNGVIARDAFFELARLYDAGVWDLFSLMGGLNSMRQWQSVKLAQVDKVHFTKAGYLLLGDMLYNAFIDYYKKIDSSR